MTEEEAKTKWCPFARCVAGEETAEGAKTSSATPTFNRIALSNGWTAPHGAKCGGSTCMAWRREHSTHTDPRTYRPNKDGHGYCGLAGARQ